MLEYDVDWLLLQPSLLLKMLLQAEKRGLYFPNINYLECTGEKLSEETQEKMKEFYHLLEPYFLSYDVEEMKKRFYQ